MFDKIELQAILYYLNKQYDRDGNTTYVPDTTKRSEKITLYTVINKLNSVLKEE